MSAGADVGRALEGSGWFAVRCMFSIGAFSAPRARGYEERITLWRAGSFEAAVEMAEAEASQYAATVPDLETEYLGLAQALRLFDDPDHGAEVFSLMRRG